MDNGIVLKPEVIGYLQGLPVTNTIFTSWVVMAVIVIFSLLATWRVKLVPSGLQNLFEVMIETGYQTVSDLAHSKTKVFFPVVMTFFFYILFGNLIGLLPGFAAITYHGETLLRSINSDLNMTLGLALTSAV